MAKLSAYKRTEIARLIKENPNPDSDLIVWEKVTVALMSDGKVLQKREVRFKPSPFGGNDKHTYNWTVKGKIRKGLSTLEFVEIYLKNGFSVKS